MNRQRDTTRTLPHVFFGVGVDDLIAERPQREVRPLRDKDELRRWRLADDTTCTSLAHHPETNVRREVNVPYTGHNPPRIRNKEDFPQPSAIMSTPGSGRVYFLLTIRSDDEEVLLVT